MQEIEEKLEKASEQYYLERAEKLFKNALEYGSATKSNREPVVQNYIDRAAKQNVAHVDVAIDAVTSRFYTAGLAALELAKLVKERPINNG